MKFLCDAMLHKLCNWLRMAGHQAAFTDAEDDEVIKQAIATNSILLTRDKQLSQKAANYCKVQLLASTRYLEQLREVAKLNKIKLKFTDSYCTTCGGKLKRVEKKKIKNKLWPYTYKTHAAFRQCIKCGQVYWRGTHTEKIKRKILSATN